ncbi:MAG: hypothetical protein KGN34_16175 [Sphingomonadales bacterium]|nr:hypothetical protein [Sphingomonadales bacterium]
MLSQPSLRVLAASALALVALAGTTPLAAQTPSPDAMRQVAMAAAELRARIAADPAAAAQARLALARLAALQGTLAMQRHQQGGVISADQQARALARLEAWASAGR